MADVSKLTINNDEYDLKDAVARADIADAQDDIAQAQDDITTLEGNVETLDDSKVSKSGDTMTGTLDIKSTSIDSSVTPSASQFLTMLRGIDKNGVTVSNIRMTFTASGNEYLQFLAHRVVSGVDKYNNFSIGLDSSGNPIFYTEHPTEFRNALGIDDTGWLTIGKPTGATYTGTAKYRRIGKLVYIELDSIANLTEGVNIGYLQSGCRPSNNIFFPLVAGYNQYRQQGLIRIYTGGAVQLHFQTSDAPIAQTQFYGTYSFMVD